MSTSVGSPSMGVKILLVGGALLLFVMVCWIVWVIMQPEEPETQPEPELEPAAESGPDSSLVRAAPAAAVGGQQARTSKKFDGFCSGGIFYIADFAIFFQHVSLFIAHTT